MNFGTNNTTTAALLIPVHIPGLRFLVAFCCILIYIFGYTGCFLSILTFSSKKLRHHSTGFLFLIMAFVDMLNLFASLQYYLNGIYQINVFLLSVHTCRFLTIFNYELYFAFSWIFVFISVDRWIKVEWPTKSQTLCTREKFIYLCIISLIISLLKNIIYAFLCFDAKCDQKNLACDIFIQTIYISLYMTVPIAIILISICRTCLITINLGKRFQNSTINLSKEKNLNDMELPLKLDTLVHCNSGTITTRISNSIGSSLSSTTTTNTTNHSQFVNPSQRLAHYRRRRSRMDAQMIILISINVAPFILVHIITEIAYLFEKYSEFVRQSPAAELIIILVYLSWYLISASRFYTNCLLSRIYREEFKTRLLTLRNGCKPRAVIQNERRSSRRLSSRYYLGSMAVPGESTNVIMKSITLK